MLMSSFRHAVSSLLGECWQEMVLEAKMTRWEGCVVALRPSVILVGDGRRGKDGEMGRVCGCFEA